MLFHTLYKIFEIVHTRSTQNIMIGSLVACIPLQLLASGDEYGGEHEVESSLPGMIIKFPYLMYWQKWLKCLWSRRPYTLTLLKLIFYTTSVDTAHQL